MFVVSFFELFTSTTCCLVDCSNKSDVNAQSEREKRNEQNVNTRGMECSRLYALFPPLNLVRAVVFAAYTQQLHSSARRRRTRIILYTALVYCLCVCIVAKSFAIYFRIAYRLIIPFFFDLQQFFFIFHTIINYFTSPVLLFFKFIFKIRFEGACSVSVRAVNNSYD